ncbi:MAG: hypothetical protein JRE20_09100 [Deltaproteobacteria bacterium]|jgi:hypothetical protein|nr:hypothetical protein [Deltaproteobacteria bacterium]
MKLPVQSSGSFDPACKAWASRMLEILIGMDSIKVLRIIYVGEGKALY